MIPTNKFSSSATMAISAAILCSSPALFAQEASPVSVTQPTAPVTVAPPSPVQTTPEVAAPSTVLPPPAVRTVPDSALDQPVANNSEPRAAIERQAPRRAAANGSAQPRVTETPRAVVVSPTVEPAEEVTANVDFAPASDEMPFGDGNGQATGTAVLQDQPDASGQLDAAEDDWLVYGGLAAALGLAGVGGLVASRRRRARASGVRQNDDMAPVAVPANNTAYNPAAAASPISVIKQSPVSRPASAERNLPPVTDPLFAHKAELGPITDPLFSQQVAMPPVTDPMFAKYEDYAGTSSAGAALDKRRDPASTPGNHNATVREVEPAE